jgi:hypothetical protein
VAKILDQVTTQRSLRDQIQAKKDRQGLVVGFKALVVQLVQVWVEAHSLLLIITSDLTN